MAIVRINGYSRNEGSKDFKILDRKEIKNILNDLNINEIYYETFLEALKYDFSGVAYAYLDAITGEVKKGWLQQNTSNHPWDDFNEIILCTIHTPIEIVNEDFWVDKDEEKEAEERGESAEDYIINKYGEKELNDRIDNIAWYYGGEFKLDYNNIEEQLDKLYFHIITEE